MAKKKEIEPPYLACAIFCDKVLTEKDGVLSAIRIVDRVSVHASGITPADGQELVLPVTTNMLVVLKSGGFEGVGELRVVGFKPSGDPLEPELVSAPVELLGPDASANVVIQMQLQVQESEQGLFWFDIYFDGRLLTRTPLSVRITSSEEPLQSPVEEPDQNQTRSK